jgi:Uridine kinase
MTVQKIKQIDGQVECRSQTYINYHPVIEAVKKIVDENKPIIIAIDGRCGSGKSSLTVLLAEMFNCNIFHLDDFFLPFEMKTEERLTQPGGNVHYERFKAEVLESLQKHEAVTYRPYRCSIGALGEPVHVEFKNLTIVEGAYSLHPALKEVYGYKIFLTIDPEIQRERILRRNGEKALRAFLDKWIPMEEYYFSELNIQAQCDLIFDTTPF